MKNKFLIVLMLSIAIMTGCAKQPIEYKPSVPETPVAEVESIENETENLTETPTETVKEPVVNPVEESQDWVTETIANLGLQEHKEINVDGGDTSGYRNSLVKVDIGYGDREYWGFTNEHGQLITVIAETITLQNDSTEDVNSSGRYYSKMADVPGVGEEYGNDRGHVIADSLGGVSNAYNITPQEATLNRHGDQAYMERVIRDAGGATYFVATIEYENTKTQIPSYYNYDYTVKGNVVSDRYPNKNPEKTSIEVTTPTTLPEEPSIQNEDSASPLKIIALDKVKESVKILNEGPTEVDIGGWKLVSETGSQSFTLPMGTMINSGQTLEFTSGEAAGTGDFTMAEGNIWNNSTEDPAILYNNYDEEVSRFK